MGRPYKLYVGPQFARPHFHTYHFTWKVLSGKFPVFFSPELYYDPGAPLAIPYPLPPSSAYRYPPIRYLPTPPTSTPPASLRYEKG